MFNYSESSTNNDKIEEEKVNITERKLSFIKLQHETNSNLVIETKTSFNLSDFREKFNLPPAAPKNMVIVRIQGKRKCVDGMF